jgi:hypothetical protein
VYDHQWQEITTIRNIKQKDSAKRKFLQRRNSSSLKKYMDDTGVNGRLTWFCMGTLAWCYQSHRASLQWMHFVVISLTESEIG